METNYPCHENQEGSIWAPDLIKHNGHITHYPAAGTNWVVTADRSWVPGRSPCRSVSAKSTPATLPTMRVGGTCISPGETRSRCLQIVEAITPLRKIHDGWPIPRDSSEQLWRELAPKILNVVVNSRACFSGGGRRLGQTAFSECPSIKLPPFPSDEF